jgi:transcriptional regulator with XRE-family HTH domain
VQPYYTSVFLVRQAKYLGFAKYCHFVQTGGLSVYSIFEELLKANNTTAYQVSKATGISSASMTDWKKGRYTLKADKLKKIADYFGVTVDYLLGNEEKEKTPPVPMTEKEELISRLTDALSTFSVEQLRVMVYMVENQKPE